MTTLVIINNSNKLSDSEGYLMTMACQLQLTKHAAPLLERRTWILKYIPKGKIPPSSAFPIVIFDNPDQAGVLGYHAQDTNGKPYGRVFIDPVLSYGGTMLQGSLSVSSVLSHEVLETFVDYNVNLWADRYDGTEVAVEVCDPVESDCYDVMVAYPAGSVSIPVSVSNFVLDEWFDVEAVSGSRLDYMKKISKPLQMSEGGYLIVRTLSTGEITSVWGSKEAEELHNQRKPSHPAARTSKRQKK